MTTITLKLTNSLANFNHLIYCPETRDCLVIDPLDVDQIIQTAKANKLNITQMVNTHEHRDHTDGNLMLKEKTGATVFAHHQAIEMIPGVDQGLHHDDCIQVGNCIALTVLDTPGHTLHSICLYDAHTSAIYTGDTLFNCGCGNCHRGGDPAVMFDTFETVIQHLPDSTKIYPGHDYMHNNLQFAKSLQPDLSVIDALLKKLTEKDIYISTLGEDKTVDPFFRLDDIALISAMRQQIALPEYPSRKDVFLALRTLRDKW